MYKDRKILCVIPARGGSKRVPGKNTLLLNGVPLIGFTIRAAKASKYIDHVIVSTEDETIANVSREFGAEIPFIRPAELATDTAPLVPVLQDAVTRMREKESFAPDLHVLIQPTSPFVETIDIDAAIEMIVEKGTDSCVSVCEIVDRPESMYWVKDNIATSYVNVPPTRSQDLPEIYRINGAVYVTKIETLMEGGKVFDNASCAAVVMPRERSIDVDTPLDFTIAEVLFTKDKR